MRAFAQTVAELAAAASVRAAIDWFRRERAWINEQHLTLCRIPAPTFFEEKRAEWMAQRFRSIGWEARIDRAGNVVARLPGSREPVVAVTAHLDTVYAPRLPEEIKVNGDGRFLGPGVSDNGAGLAALLALAAAWNASPPVRAACWPMLVANVGEEGEGNLSGMRYLCRPANLPKLRALLVLDGPSTDHITSQALASRRFDLTITGAGGHSWSDSGTGNPIHALSRAVAWFTDQAAAVVAQFRRHRGRIEHQRDPHGSARQGGSALGERRADRVPGRAAFCRAGTRRGARKLPQRGGTRRRAGEGNRFAARGRAGARRSDPGVHPRRGRASGNPQPPRLLLDRRQYSLIAGTARHLHRRRRARRRRAHHLGMVSAGRTGARLDAGAAGLVFIADERVA